MWWPQALCMLPRASTGHCCNTRMGGLRMCAGCSMSEHFRVVTRRLMTCSCFAGLGPDELMSGSKGSSGMDSYGEGSSRKHIKDVVLLPIDCSVMHTWRYGPPAGAGHAIHIRASPSKPGDWKEHLTRLCGTYETPRDDGSSKAGALQAVKAALTFEQIAGAAVIVQDLNFAAKLRARRRLQARQQRAAAGSPSLVDEPSQQQAASSSLCSSPPSSQMCASVHEGATAKHGVAQTPSRLQAQLRIDVPTAVLHTTLSNVELVTQLEAVALDVNQALDGLQMSFAARSVLPALPRVGPLAVILGLGLHVREPLDRSMHLQASV